MQGVSANLNRRQATQKALLELTVTLETDGIISMILDTHFCLE